MKTNEHYEQFAKHLSSAFKPVKFMDNGIEKDGVLFVDTALEFCVMELIGGIFVIHKMKQPEKWETITAQGDGLQADAVLDACHEVQPLGV